MKVPHHSEGWTAISQKLRNHSLIHPEGPSFTCGPANFSFSLCILRRLQFLACTVAEGEVGGLEMVVSQKVQLHKDESYKTRKKQEDFQDKLGWVWV